MPSDSASLAAIESVYRARSGDFFRFALARTGDADLARDAVQEGFARAIRARLSFGGTGSLEAWIGRCVLNAARDAVTMRMRESAHSTPVTVSPQARNGDLRTAVRRLPTRQRDAIFLRFYLDFDYATIAAVLDIEVGTVSATLHAARQSLKKALEEARR
jgi:RNA polymerase sigma factor (sigma-70 family)